MTDPVHIIGGGLAGSEAAWQLARAGLPVVIHEMRPVRMTEAHATDRLAELVCSNSFRSDDADHNAVGLLHHEMRRLGSLIMDVADKVRVPAGSALAVDRELFAEGVTEAISNEKLIRIERGEATSLPPPEWGPSLVATGPLTGSDLARDIIAATGEGQLAFFDAIAPIVERDSIDMGKAWFQSRYDKGDGADYINCPMDRACYDAFIDALLAAEKTAFKEWERDTPYFEGCLPIEVMAERGRETLAHGPMKPVGLRNPHDSGKRPHAVVQLRQDNRLGTLYNMVGFQTKLRHGEQQRVFRMIPGLENAVFARLGGIHRNTFINSPRLLDPTLRLKARPHVRFAGQITGCEGYVESTAVGLMAARFIIAERRGLAPSRPPATTALGALLDHITGNAMADSYQPMNVTFGLFPELDDPSLPKRLKGRDRKKAHADRARRDLEAWLA